MLLGGISKTYMLSNSEINKLSDIGKEKEKKMYTHGKSNDTQLKYKNNINE